MTCDSAAGLVRDDQFCLKTELSSVTCTLGSTSIGDNIMERDKIGEGSNWSYCAIFPPLVYNPLDHMQGVARP